MRGCTALWAVKVSDGLGSRGSVTVDQFSVDVAVGGTLAAIRGVDSVTALLT